MPEEKLRTLNYLALRIAERWGQDPEWFWQLDRAQQIELLAYEDLRGEEAIGGFSQ